MFEPLLWSLSLAWHALCNVMEFCRVISFIIVLAVVLLLLQRHRRHHLSISLFFTGSVLPLSGKCEYKHRTVVRSDLDFRRQCCKIHKYWYPSPRYLLLRENNLISQKRKARPVSTCFLVLLPLLMGFSSYQLAIGAEENKGLDFFVFAIRDKL